MLFHQGDQRNLDSTLIKSNSGDLEVDLAPNPSESGYFTIKLTQSDVEASAKLLITNSIGQTTYDGMITGTKSIDLRAQPNGFYLLHVLSLDGTNRVSKKLIIEK